MNKETLQLIAKEIEILLPVEKFEPKLRKLHSGLCKGFAEDLIRKIPDGLEVYESEGKPLIRRKPEPKEGFEKMVEDSTSFSFNAETMPTIEELLEVSVHPSWNKLINDNYRKYTYDPEV